MVRCSRCSTEVEETRQSNCPFCNTPVQTPARTPTNAPPPYPFAPPANTQPVQAPPTTGMPGYGGSQPLHPPPATPLFGSPNPMPLQSPPRQTGYGTPNFNSTGPSQGTKYRHESGALKWGAIASTAGLTLLYILFRVGVRVIAYNAMHNGGTATASASASDGGFVTSSGSESNPQASEMRSPEAAARNVINTLHTQNWTNFYYASAFARNERKTSTEAWSFTNELSRLLSTSKNGRDFIQVMGALSNISVSPAVEHGDSCDVAISASTSYMGQPLKLNGTAHLIKLGDAWYLNLLGENGRSSAASFGDLAGLGNLRAEGGSLIFPHGGSFFVPPPPVIDMTGRNLQYRPNQGYTSEANPSNPANNGYNPQAAMPGQGNMPPGMGMRSQQENVPGNPPNGSPFGPRMGPRFGPPQGGFSGPRFGPGQMGFRPGNPGMPSGSTDPSNNPQPNGDPQGNTPAGIGNPGAPDSAAAPDRRGGF